MSYWYIEGAAGARFNWTKSPTYVCPFADGAPAMLTDALDEAADEAVAPRTDKFIAIWTTAHRRYSSGRERVDGRLTDRCSVCGAQMDRLGFRAWATEPAPEDSSTARIADRLGFDGQVMVKESTRYFRTKKQAEAWARAQAAKSKKGATA